MHRKLLERDLKEGICWCCKRLFNKLYVHHVNGNHNDNHLNNLICVCQKCHTFIHKGFKKRNRINEETIDNILILRKEIIKKKYNNDVDDFLKYERAIVTNRISTLKKCYHCGTLKNVELIAPLFVLKFDKTNSKHIGFPLCNECISKSIKNNA
jgi:hypothetical protein